MITIILAGALLAAGAGEGGAEQLQKAAEKLTSAESYTFRVTTKSEGAPGGMTMAPPDADEPVTGEFQKSQPVHLKRGSNELFRLENHSVFKSGEGDWKPLDRPMGGRMGGGEGGRQRRPDSAGNEPGEGGENEGGGEPPRRRAGPNPLMAGFMLNSTPIPHRILTDIQKKVESVTTETKDGKTVFVAKLNAEGAQELNSARSGPWGQGRQGGGKPPENSGSIRVTTAASGEIEKIEIDSNTKFHGRDGQEFERNRKTTIEISNLGKTKVEVPKEAQAKLKTA
jgi:hypothetical protein